MCTLDYDSVAAADKFGNIYVSRLPAEGKDDVSFFFSLSRSRTHGALSLARSLSLPLPLSLSPSLPAITV